jgi:hypothetical protein
VPKASRDALNAKGKVDIYYFDPDDVVLVTDESSPLYDERVHLPVKEELVINMMYAPDGEVPQGVLKVCVGRRNPETGKVEITDGRQRAKACREANRRLKKTIRLRARVLREPPVPADVGPVAERRPQETRDRRGRVRPGWDDVMSLDPIVCPSCGALGGHAHQTESAVDHPSHYNASPSGIECIDVVEHMTFNVGNAVKYLWRHGLKPSASSVTDLKKAAWYIQREIERVSKEKKP